MKKISILWAVLPMMAAALIITACSSDDETTAGQGAAKTIPYTVTVGQDEAAATRATVDADLKTLKFAAGDKLYVTGANIKGVLAITGGTGTASATFSGNLTYSGSGTPADGLALTATLVSAQQTVGTQVSVDAVGAVTVNYPSTAYCADVATAVQKYSNLTGTSTYGKKSFSLSQQTAFLNFVVPAGDGSSLSAVVSNGGVAICTANVTPTTENSKTVAKFVLPVASGTTLSSATVKVGENDALTITNATLTGKVYNVDKTSPFANVVSSDVGKVIGIDGKIYANATAATTAHTIAVAMIAYVGTASDCSHGLAIALENVSSNGLTWDNSGSNNGGKTAAEWCNDWNENTSKKVAGGTWRLPSEKDWQYMFIGCGLGESYGIPYADMTRSYSAFNSKLTSAGGSSAAISSGYLWTGTENDGGKAWRIRFYLQDLEATFKTDDKTLNLLVRACLAF